MQKNIKLTIEYDGTAYCGWQVQKNGPSVQAAVENAILKLTGETVKVRGAGRTDSGVHARGQVAAFRTACTIPPDKIAIALNSRLPKDITIRSSEEASDNFDPRRHAKLKLYRYTIINSPIRPALERNTAWHVKYPLDRDAMARAAKMFEGTYDFTSFSNAERNCDGLDNIRTVDRSELIFDGEHILYEVEGRSFLYNMVRALTGTIVDVGIGSIKPEDIPEIFAARNRQSAGQGAPPQGLCMVWIKYE